MTAGGEKNLVRLDKEIQDIEEKLLSLQKERQQVLHDLIRDAEERLQSFRAAQTPPPGPSRRGRTLTPTQVRQIRHLMKAGLVSHPEIAKEFNVSVPTVRRIGSGETYADVLDDLEGEEI